MPKNGRLPLSTLTYGNRHKILHLTTGSRARASVGLSLREQSWATTVRGAQGLLVMEANTMAEHDETLSVTLVRASLESQAVVEDPQTRPWSLVETDDPRTWTMMIYMTPPGESEGRYFAFASRDVAREWADAHGITDILWDPDRERASVVPEEFIAKYGAIAAESDLADDSAEAFERARADEDLGRRFRSLTFYPEPGMVRNATQPPCPIPSGEIYTLPWTPASCRHAGFSQMWDAEWNLPLVYSGEAQDVPSLPLAVVYAYSV